MKPATQTHTRLTSAASRQPSDLNYNGSVPVRKLKPSEIEALTVNLPERYVSEVRRFFHALPSAPDGGFLGYMSEYEKTIGMSEVAHDVIWEGYQRAQLPASFKKTKTQYDEQLDAFSVVVKNKPDKRAQHIVEFLVRRGWTLSEIAFHIGVNISVMGAVREGAKLEFNAMCKLEKLFDGGNCDTAWNGGQRREDF